MAKKRKEKKEIHTRKNEERFFTSDPAEMRGKYTAGDVFKKWVEDFVDESTGEATSIERKQLLISRGVLIEGDTFANIQFYLQSGEIEGVEVSNQKRQAFLFEENGYLTPWCVKARVKGKNRPFLLYAPSIDTALEIVKDYIELNFSGGFGILSAKTFDSCIFLKTPVPEVAEGEAEAEPVECGFYRIEIEVRKDDGSSTHTFVLQVKDIDSAMIYIKEWITEQLRKEHKKRNKGNDEDFTPEFTTVLKSGATIPCYRFIEREFSKAYTTADSYIR